MEIAQHKTPNYVRFTFILIAVSAITYILFIGQGILIPIVLSAFFAILLHPVVRFFLKGRMNRLAAITLTVLIAFLLVAGITWFIVSQVTMFWESIPILEKKCNLLLSQGCEWMANTLNIRRSSVLQWLDGYKSEFLANSTAYLSATVYAISETSVILTLIPIYTFMILYYEPLFLGFIHKVFPKDDHPRVDEVISESKTIMQRYLAGLLLEAIIVAVLNSVGLVILGIEYAILWGIIGALLNIIPYIGTIVAVIFPILMSIITKDSVTYAILVMGLYFIIQMIDNNIIVPKIVASKLKINALVSILAVVIGGSIWGVPGMFIAIPLTAVIKIIFDRISYLMPYGYLLGDEMQSPDSKLINLFRPKSNTRIKVH